MLVAALCAGLLAVPAAAAERVVPDAVNQARLDLTIRHLQEVQNPDGGYGGRVGGSSDFGFSAWVGLALAAGGINPMDQKRPGGTDLYGYLIARSGSLRVDEINDYSRTLMVVNAAGGDPHDFGGIDLVATILERQLPDGSFRKANSGSYAGHNDAAFAILALQPVGGRLIETATERAARWLLTRQTSSGGWGHSALDPPNSDMTGAVLQALRAAGVVDHDAELRAWQFLRGLQGPGGGFAMSAEASDENSASTAWVVQAMWATGVDPHSWRVGAGDPLDHLASLQQSDGAIFWKTDEPTNSTWMTAYAAPAFAGHPLPIPRVERAVSPDEDITPPTEQMPVDTQPDPVNRGRGGTVKKGRGNTVAGGGAGAPLFSRPQPQSRGRIAGAPRRTRNSSNRRRTSGAREGRGGSTRSQTDRPSRGGDFVSGVVVGDSADALGVLRERRAAPGPRSAELGGSVPQSSYVICALLLVGIGLGTRIELRPQTNNPLNGNHR